MSAGAVASAPRASSPPSQREAGASGWTGGAGRPRARGVAHRGRRRARRRSSTRRRLRRRDAAGGRRGPARSRTGGLPRRRATTLSSVGHRRRPRAAQLARLPATAPAAPPAAARGAARRAGARSPPAQYGPSASLDRIGARSGASRRRIALRAPRRSELNSPLRLARRLDRARAGIGTARMSVTREAQRPRAASSPRRGRASGSRDLQFWHRSEARLALVATAGARRSCCSSPGPRSARRRPATRARAAGAARDRCRGRGCRSLRHAPLLLFLAGLPFFFLALADPYTALVSREASFPGRRIGLMIDASISMRTPFTAATLNKRAPTDADVLHDGGRRRAVRAAAHEGPVPRSARARRVRQRGVRRHAVHERLRQHPAQHLAHRRSGRVLACSPIRARSSRRPSRRASSSSRRSTFSTRPATSW